VIRWDLGEEDEVALTDRSAKELQRRQRFSLHEPPSTWRLAEIPG